MELRLTEDMREKIWLYVIVIATGISIYFTLDKIDFIIRSFRRVYSLTTPFILGLAIVFLSSKPMELIEVRLLGKLRMKPQHKQSIAAVLAALLGIIIVCTFLALLLPQLFNSIFSLVKAFLGYVEDFRKLTSDFVEKYAVDAQRVTSYITNTDFFEELTGFVADTLPQMAKATYAFRNTLLSILLSIVAGLYMLIDGGRLSGYAKKINYALFPEEINEYLHRIVLASGDIFDNFIAGKVIDPLIIRVLCYIGSLVFQFSYALLLSMIVGVTNTVSVFGPFVGAVSGIVILFVIHPVTALYFVLFVFAPQQFDGNILGPLILGNKLGLPSTGILFSVYVEGGLFGIIGMFIGIPCFTVIYMVVREFVNYRLKREEIDPENISRKIKKEALEIEERMEQSEE